MQERERALRSAISITLETMCRMKSEHKRSNRGYAGNTYSRWSDWEPILHVHNYLIQELENLCR